MPTTNRENNFEWKLVLKNKKELHIDKFYSTLGLGSFCGLTWTLEHKESLNSYSLKPKGWI